MSKTRILGLLKARKGEILSTHDPKPVAVASESDMTEIKGKKFDQVAIALDRNAYVDCTFTRCRMTFAGLKDLKLVGCKFLDCTWEFGGPAARTIAFMTALYAMGGEGSQLVEATFENIRKGTERVD